MHCDNCDTETKHAVDREGQTLCRHCAFAETIYLILDTDNRTAAEWLEWHGEEIDGVPVVAETLGRPLNTYSSCEQCGEMKLERYRLQVDPAGVFVCRSCLGSYEWVVGIAESEEQIAQIAADAPGVLT